jgi:hypothetical protein
MKTTYTVGQTVIHTDDLNQDHIAYVKAVDGEHVNLDFFDGDEGWERIDTLTPVPTMCNHCLGYPDPFGCGCNLTEEEARDREATVRFWCD